MRRSYLLRIAVGLGLASASAGCTNQPAPVQPTSDLVRCYAQALAPLVEPTFDALELAQQIAHGEANLPQVLRAVGATVADVRALRARVRACQAAPDAGPPSPSPSPSPSLEEAS